MAGDVLKKQKLLQLVTLLQVRIELSLFAHMRAAQINDLCSFVSLNVTAEPTVVFYNLLLFSWGMTVDHIHSD